MNTRSMLNRKESHHRHRRPHPPHTFTPYPPIYQADLSRPPHGDPSRPGPPPSPNCRATPPPWPTPPASTTVLPSCSSSIGTPSGTGTPAQRVRPFRTVLCFWLAPVFVCFRALDSRRPDAIQVEIVIVWRGQRVTGKSTLIIERSWVSRAYCSLLALLGRSTSHPAGTRMGEAGTRLLRRNGKQFRQGPWPVDARRGECGIIAVQRNDSLIVAD